MVAFLIACTALVVSLYSLTVQVRIYQRVRRERMQALALKKLMEENMFKEIGVESTLKLSSNQNLYRIGPHTLRVEDKANDETSA